MVSVTEPDDDLKLSVILSRLEDQMSHLQRQSMQQDQPEDSESAAVEAVMQANDDIEGVSDNEDVSRWCEKQRGYHASRSQ